MPRAGLVSSAAHLCPLLLVLLVVTQQPLSVAASVTESPSTDPDFWKIIIDNGPAPSPEDGPPGARHASRNKALLPYQICGIVGGYLLCLLIIGICLLTFGRRMRREAQEMAATPPMEIELMKSPIELDLASPKSPTGSTKSWLRSHLPLRSPRKSGTSLPTSPGVASVSSFDAKVIENDRIKAQSEMENLYAAVMAHEARKSQNSVVAEHPSSPISPSFPTSPFQPVNKNLRRIATGNPANGPSPISPTSPSFRAVHPTERLPYGLVSPTTPGSIPPGSPGAPPSPLFAGGMYPAAQPDKGTATSISTRMEEARPPPAEPPVSPRSPRSPRAFFSRQSRNGSVSSQGSKTSKLRKPLANIRISHPYAVGDEDERVPLTPKSYSNVPPAPSPPAEPPTPHTADSVGHPDAHCYAGPADADADTYEAIDKPAPLPRPAPQRGTSHPSNRPPTVNHSDSPRAAQSSSNDLPLRSAQSSTTELPLRASHSPGALSEAKTTYLERKKDPLAKLRGPTSALRTATTPYSPYMPFTPITPVTPHLVSKAERKALKKEKKARFDPDQVIDEDDMWGAGL